MFALDIRKGAVLLKVRSEGKYFEDLLRYSVENPYRVFQKKCKIRNLRKSPGFFRGVLQFLKDKQSKHKFLLINCK